MQVVAANEKMNCLSLGKHMMFCLMGEGELILRQGQLGKKTRTKKNPGTSPGFLIMI